MRASFPMIILFVADVSALRDFYTSHFGMQLLEEIPEEWTLLSCGMMQLGLHRIGKEYAADEIPVRYHNNTKLVFEVTEPLESMLEQLKAANVPTGPIQQWPGYAYRIFDGKDPEGNMFQLREKSRA